MKTIFFVACTILSLISLVLAGILLGIHFTEESPGMIMIFLVPLLFFGIIMGSIALLIKKITKPKLNQFLVWIYYSNLFLIGLGTLALVYIFLE